MSPFVWVETITLVNSHEHATITADKPIQVKYLGGKPNSSSSSGEIRGFTSLPSSALSNTYYAPVGSFEHYSSRSKKQTDAFFYNPQNSAIIIHWNSGAQSGSFTLSAHDTTSFHQKTRHYLTQDRATIFTSSQKYIAISTVGTNSPSYDWGYNLLPKEYLQNDYAIGWTETRTGGRDGTPLFITASENGTSVFIDTNNDGTPDHTYLVDKYEMQKVYDTSSSHNFQGAHIWSTRPIAIVWGQDPSRASNTANLDMGYPIIPQKKEWMTTVVDVQKSTHQPTLQAGVVGQESTYTLHISSYSNPIEDITASDLLPSGWSYVNGSTTIEFPDGSTKNNNPAISGQTLTWNSSVLGDMGINETITIIYDAITTTTHSAGTITNNAATVTIVKPIVLVTTSQTSNTFFGMNVNKTSNPQNTPLLPGNTIDYTIEVENTGTDALHGVDVTDSLPLHTTLVAGSCSVNSGSNNCHPFPNLVIPSDNYDLNNQGDTLTVTFQVTVDSGIDPSVTSIDNNVSVLVDEIQDPFTDKVTDPLAPALPMDAKVTKTANKSYVLEPGGDVTYTFSVENNGSVDLEVISLIDSVFGDVHCSTLPTVIPVGGVYTCNTTQYISGATGTTHNNTVVAKLKDPIFNRHFDRNDTLGVGIHDVPPAISVTKDANETSVPDPGQDVEFTVTVHNASHVEDLILTILNDDIFGNIDGSGTCTLPQTIAADGDYTCSFIGHVAGSDGDLHTNTITATGHDNENTTVTGKAPAFVGIGAAPIPNVDPNIYITKNANITSVPEPGTSSIEFTFEVTNTSTTSDMNLTSLHDNIYGDVSLDSACANLPVTLAQNATYTCKITRPVLGDAGSVHTNLVKAIAVDSIYGFSIKKKAQESINITDVLPSIEVIKDANVTTVTAPGENVNFQVVVKNRSLVEPLILTSLEDDIFGSLAAKGTCPPLPFTIATDSNLTCNFVAFVSAPAYTTHTNTITAIGKDDENNIVTDNDPHSINSIPGPIDTKVTKTATPSVIAEPGGNVVFTYSVENNGSVDLNLTSLYDDKFGDVCYSSLPASIAVGDIFTCNISKSITGSTGFVHNNKVTAQLIDKHNRTIKGDANATVDVYSVPPALNIAKDANVSSLYEGTTTVEFSLDIINVSSVKDLTITDLNDSIFGSIDGNGTCPSLPFTLAAGTTHACTFNANLTGNAGDVHSNVITVRGHDNVNTAVYANDVKHLDFYPKPLIDAKVTKTSNRSTVLEPGGDVIFTYSVENNGTIDLELTALRDDKFGDVHCGTLPTTIAVGDTYSCGSIHHVSGNANDMHQNTVTAELKDKTFNRYLSPTATHQIPITDAPPLIAVTKSPNKTTVTAPGEDVTFTVTVHNYSHVETFELTDLDDSVFGDLLSATSTTCSLPQNIIADGDYSCSFSGYVQDLGGGMHDNVVTAKGHDDDSNIIQVYGPAHIGIGAIVPPIVDPSIIVDKQAASNNVAEPGTNNMSFTFSVTNDSTISDMNLTSLHDNVYGDIATLGNCPSLPITLPRGNTYNCTITNVAVMGNAGDTHTNTVRAIAVDSIYGYSAKAEANETIHFTNVDPSINITKDANVTKVLEPGENVTFTTVLFNQSIVEPITVTTFEDNLFGVLKDANSSTCPSLPFVIAPDSNLTCSFVGYVAGVDGDIHENIITAIGHDDENNPTTVKAPKHIPIYALPIVDAVVTKTSNKASVPEPGGDVTYTFSVENSGSADLELTSLVDSVFGDVHCSTLPTTIKIGDTYTCSITKYISGNAGYINHNTVIAKLIEPIYKIPLDRNDSHQVEVTDVPPAITVTKVPNKTTVTAPGEDVTFTVTVYNHSHAEDFKLTDLDDSIFGNLLSATSTTCTLPQSIAADGDYSCSFSGLVSGSANSVHHNIVTAIGHDDENIVIEAKGPAHVGIGAPPSITVDPSIKVFKEAALNSVPEPGINDMEFTFTVENNSTVSDMNLTSLHDNIYGDVALDPACPSLPITIPQGAIYTCKITRAVMGSPRNSHVNTVKAIAVDSVYGYSVMHKTKEIINFTDVAPNMSVTYDTNTTCVENSGDSVQFSIRVQNESAVDEITLTDLVDADYGDLDGKGSCQLPQVIHVGGSYTCNFTEVATANSYVLRATAHDNENNIVISSSVTSVTVGSCNTGVPLPNVIVTKNTDKSTVVTPGEDVEFTFSVTNSSTTDAIITSLQDNLFGDVSCTALPYLLKVGQSYTCKHTEYISGSSGDTHQNRVTATLQVGLAVYHNDANKTIPVTDKPIAVPTFSEWGRLLLIVLFLLFAYRILRLQPKAITTRK